MKRKWLLAAVLFFMAALAGAETRTDFNFGLFTEPSDELYVSGVRFNFIYGKAKEVNGASMGIVNITQGKLTGMESGFVNIGMETNGMRTGFVNLLDGSVNGVVTGFVNNTGSITGAACGFVNNAKGGVTGTISGFVNNVEGNVTGAMSGFVNNAANASGSVAGFYNNIPNMSGVEAGFINCNRSIHGIAAGFVNVSNEVNGYVSGFVNVLGKAEGVETGFVNVSDKTTGIMTGFVNVCGDLDGAALGAVNVIKGGFGKISLYTTVESFYNVAFKSGKGFYGILGAGYDMRETVYADKYTAVVGMGYHYDAKPFFIDWEALYNMNFRNFGEDFDWKKDMRANVEFRILPGINIGDMFDIYAGPSVKYLSNGEITRRDSWKWTEDTLRFSAVAGINIRVF